MAGYTKEVKEKFGVEIVDSIEDLLKKVDVVLLESVDGRPHLKQVEPVLKAKKPVFIDKPVAGTLADAVAIFQLAEKYWDALLFQFVVAIQSNHSEGDGRSQDR